MRERGEEDEEMEEEEEEAMGGGAMAVGEASDEERVGGEEYAGDMEEANMAMATEDLMI